MLADTIVAVATPPGRGGIAVLRLSGSRARDIASAVLRNPALLPAQPNVSAVVDVADPDRAGVALDRAIATWFQAPRSYTGEDVVELSLHGSPVLVELALGAVLAAGARLATPGEFSLRGFLNGRMDLTQAEAVRDLVNAQTGHQARQAQRHLRGALSRRLAPVRERLLDLIVQLESSVEFVEDDIEPATRAALSRDLASTAADLAALKATHRLGRIVAGGFSVALAGRPNAGKSSLFNRLVESERAIVTSTPGTTRDLVSEHIEIDGIPVRLVDTAGLRETADEIERIGVDRTRSAVADADVVIVVLDARADDAESATALLGEAPGARRVIAINKVDLGAPDPDVLGAVTGAGERPLSVSARTGLGVDGVRAAVVAAAGGGPSFAPDGLLVTNARHFDALSRASAGLESAVETLDAGYSEEIALVGLHDALHSLGELTGETAIDDILDRVFATFCIGK